MPEKFVGLDDLGKALVLAALLRQAKGPLIAIFGTRGEARNALDNFRFFAGSQATVRYIPTLDFDFHRNILPSPEDTWERNRALFHLLNDSAPALYVTTVGAMLQKAIPPDQFLNSTLTVTVEEELPREKLNNALIRNGYQSLPNASDPGTYAIRGGVIDVFCPLYPHPFRLEYLGDFVESFRFFDPTDQRSLDEVKSAYIIPAQQSLTPRGGDYQAAAPRVKERLDNLGYPKTDRDELLMKIQEGSSSTTFDHLFPILSGGSAAIHDYFPANAQVVYDSTVLDNAMEFDYPKYQTGHALYEKHPSPIAELQDLVCSPGELRTWLNQRSCRVFQNFQGASDPNSLAIESLNFSAPSASEAKLPLEALAKRLHDWIDQGYRIQLVCHTQLHAERIRSLLGTYRLFSELHTENQGAYPAALQLDFQKIHIWQGYITHSSLYPDLKLLVISEEAVFGKKKRAGLQSSKKNAAQNLAALRELKLNDYVVHKDHGIGKYLGLQSRDFLGIPNDYLVIEYKDRDKLYVPVYRLNVVQKFSSAEAAPPVIDKLGGDRWAKTKSKAKKAVAQLAAQFLETHAKRKSIPIEPCRAPEGDYDQFEMEFPFDETPDQLKAIEDVNHDLLKSHPMNRLLCGDVGYGKTEIAMRAAYRIASQGRQVAILVPTTILAFQHYETFIKRFKNTGIRCDMISRLRNSAQIKSTLGQLSEGKIDILIGTHRLLSSDFTFKHLGLLVVDEEHRFGVIHKERLKKLSEAVHVLSMTATPIPRTLNMAMAGIMDISIITTPPPDRLSVRTFVCRHDIEVLKEAVSNELARDGQVYYVHNRIETIYGIADELRELFPSLRFQVVHGQVEPEELEKSMIGFFQNDFQVLVTTAIVESGLDNPRANTIVIDRADQFGLAQLYQLRGRVGRADRRAYCYLLIPAENLITKDAKERLQVMQRYSDLGSGFQIASQDLDSRGAGDLLGDQQSGHLNAVGTDLYFELLEEAIQDLQGREPKVDIEPDINLRIPAFFPEAYLPDIGERVALYRRLSSINSPDAITEFESELRDRFGTPPEEVMNLIGLMYLKLQLKTLHVIRMSCGPKKTSLQFAPTTPASPEKLVKLIQRNPKIYSITPDQKFVFDAPEADWKTLLREIELLSSRLGV
ncbi:MAG: transcription-repair coupling factor [Deltaproteobacteria bacterium]|nr:transcription-repair coupling factor [Deltaproteobacteria bacterium]